MTSSEHVEEVDGDLSLRLCGDSDPPSLDDGAGSHCSVVRCLHLSAGYVISGQLSPERLVRRCLLIGLLYQASERGRVRCVALRLTEEYVCVVAGERNADAEVSGVDRLWPLPRLVCCLRVDNVATRCGY